MSIAEPVVRHQEIVREELPVPLPPPKPARLVSLDAYRGLTMLLMVCGALHINDLAKKMKAQFDAAIKQDIVRPNEGMRLLQEFERGLKDQTYLSIE